MAAPYVWDPDRVLQITDLGRQEMICIGRAARRFNSRCAWTIEEPERSEASSLLRSMARKLPTEVRRKELRHLARLCLCHEAHQHQKVEASIELESRLEYACDDYEQFETLQMQSEALRAEVQNETANIISARIRVTTLVLENSEFEKREQGLKIQLTDMDQRLGRQTTTIAELRESGSRLQRTSDHLEQVLQEERLTMAGLEKSRTDLERQVTELGRQMSHQKSVMDEVEASKADLQGQLLKVHQQLNEQTTAVEHMAGENRTLKDQHSTAVAGLGTSGLKIAHMKFELQSVQSINADLQRQLNEAVLLLNNTWQTRLRNWLQACQSSFTKAFTRLYHILALASAKLKRAWSSRGLFRGTNAMAGEYTEV